MFRRSNTRKDEKQNILNNASAPSNDYGQKWIQKLNLTVEPQLIDSLKNRELPIHYTDLDHYNQYLDMSGNGSTLDGYIVMPTSSVRSSASSGTTISTVSTLPMDRSRSLSSATTTSNLSSNSSNQGNTTFDNLSFMPDTKINRPLSLYSAGHLYEEIPESRCEEKLKMALEASHPTTPVYTNLTEDQEGYMIPSKAHNRSNDLLKEIEVPPEVPPPNTQFTIKRIQKETQSESINQEVPLDSENDVAPPYCRVGESSKSQDNLVNNPEYDVRQPPNYDVPRNAAEVKNVDFSTKSPQEERYDVPPKPTTITTNASNTSKAKVGVSLGSIPGTIV